MHLVIDQRVETLPHIGIEFVVDHGDQIGFRPKLLEMLGQLRDGDVVVVWKLDRLSRSLKDMLHIMERIELAGAGFRSLTEAIDTTTVAGRVMMQMVGNFAEFERAMIRDLVEYSLAFAQTSMRQGYARIEATIAPVLVSIPGRDSTTAHMVPEKFAHILVSAARGFKQVATTPDELRKLIQDLLLLTLGPASAMQ